MIGAVRIAALALLLTACSAATAATASPPAAATGLPASGKLAPGTYFLDLRFVTNVDRLTFTLPDGWTTQDHGFLYKNMGQPGEVLLVPWVVTHIYRDACKWDDSDLIPAGTTYPTLMDALEAQDGRTVTRGRGPATLGGFEGERIDLAVAEDLDVSSCTNGILRYWPGAGPNFSSGFCCNQPGNTDAIYAVHAGDNRVVVVARHYPATSAADLEELQEVLASIQIEP